MILERIGIKSRSGIRGGAGIPGMTAEQLQDSLLIDPDGINEFTCYLLNREGPGPYPDGDYLELRRMILASATAVDLPDGGRIVVLSEGMSRIVSDGMEEIRRDDNAKLGLVERALSSALAEVGANGNIPADADEALRAWTHAVDEVEAFFSTQRYAGLLDLEDMLEAPEAPYALAGMLELFRRMLLAAARSKDDIGAATLGHFEFHGVDDAVSRWRISEGEPAKRLGKAIADLASRTPGFVMPPHLDDAQAGAAAWIPAYSRFGQEVMGWALGRAERRLELADVGWAWPGPSLYGYDDGEEDPRAASQLLGALSSGGRGGDGAVPELHDVIVDDKFSIKLPERFIKAGCPIYVSEECDGCGTYLSCVSESAHFGYLADLIADEQRATGFDPGAIEEGRPRNDLDGAAQDLDEEFLLNSIGSAPVEADDKGRMPLGGFHLDGLARGAVLTLYGDESSFAISERARAEERISAVEAEIDALFANEGELW